MERAKVFRGGKITIPILFRKKFNILEGEELLIDVEGDHIIISSLKAKLMSVRQSIRNYHPDETSLVDQFIAERRKEAGNE